MLEVKPPWVPTSKSPRDTDQRHQLFRAELTEILARSGGNIRTTLVGSGTVPGSVGGKVNRFILKDLQLPDSVVHRLLVVRALIFIIYSFILFIALFTFCLIL